MKQTDKRRGRGRNATKAGVRTGRRRSEVLISEFKKTWGSPATTLVCRVPGSRYCLLGGVRSHLICLIGPSRESAHGRKHAQTLLLLSLELSSHLIPDPFILQLSSFIPIRIFDMFMPEKE